MSGINRLLSRRDRHAHGDHHQEKPKQTAGLLHGLFPEEDRQIPVRDDEKKIKALSQRLIRAGITNFKEPDISYVLNAAYAKGDPEKAYDVLVLLEESEEGIIKEYNPNIKLLGAVNRDGVSCYLDSVLFAMFARLGSFEAILYNTFEDEPRKRLATLLRLWVNTLRVGKLITTDITKQIQMRLADCGWKEAASLSQQDASEAFSFITETLALPLLTLKMDIFHPGQEEEGDDHKFVNERLLEVAVPEDPGDGRLITLEECLETYFNNRIEVRRFLERRNTLKSTLSHRPASLSKGNVSHIETVELTESQTPNPVVAKPQTPIVQNSPTRPLSSRARAPSIVREYFTSEKTDGLEMSSSIEEESGFQGRQRAGSIRKEIVLPAWQFFNLIPWYTDNSATNDAQVASHFSSTRPVLGICLKRYSVLPNGHAVRRNTHIDIPIDIRLPHFIQDDAMSENGPAFGNFKLSLQSAVCHRGKSVDSGHYVSLVRSQQRDHASLDGSSTGFVSDDSVRERWMRLDDLARERVAFVEVEDFLRKESPYLLFYQVQPIDDDDFGRVIETWRSPEADGPPLYTESDSKDSAVTDLSLNYNDSLETTDNSVRSSRPSYDGVTSQREHKSTSLVIESSSSQILAGTSTNSHDTNHISNLSITNRVTDPNYLTASYGDSRGRLASRGSDKRLSRSLSRLAGKIKKDKIDEPAIAMDGVKDANLPASEGAMFEAPKVIDPNRLKKEHKEKRRHKNIHSTQNGPDGHQHFVKGKQKSEKPDRECSLM